VLTLRPNAVEKFCKLLSETFDIRVIFRGEQALCYVPNPEKMQYKVLQLPAMPNPVTPEMEFYYLGLAYHESGHVLYTDFREMSKVPKEEFTFLFKNVLNVIEDYRIEAALRQEFPGAGSRLDELHEHVLKDLAEKIGKKPQVQKTLNALILALSCAIQERDHSYFDQSWRKLLTELKDEIEEARTLNSTREAIQLTRKVMEKLKNLQEQYQQQNPQQHQQKQQQKQKQKSMLEKLMESMGGSSGEGDQEEQQGPGQSKEKQKSSGKDGKDSDQEEQQGSGGDQQEEQNEPGQGHGSAEEQADTALSQNEEITEVQEAAKALEKELEKIKDQLDSQIYDYAKQKQMERKFQQLQEDKEGKEAQVAQHQPVSVSQHAQRKIDEIRQETSKEVSKEASDLKYFVPYTTEYDKVITDFPKHGTEETIYQDIRQTVNSHVNYLSQRFRAVLRSRVPSRWRGEQDAGQLDGYRLVSAKVEANRNIFRREVKGISIDVGIQIIVDESGSMCGNDVRPTLVLLCEALHSIQIPFEVVGFTTGRDFVSHGAKVDKTVYQRYTGLEHRVYKDFNDSFPRVRTNLTQISARNYTPLPDAILFGLKRLSQVKHHRKIQWVVTDGMPYYGYHNLDETAYMNNLMDSAQLFGIELMGVGLSSDAGNLKHYFRNFVIYDSVADLPKHMIGKLEEICFGKEKREILR